MMGMHEMSDIKKMRVRKIPEKELIQFHIKWLSEYLLNWDLEDLREDIKSLSDIAEGNIDISTSKRIRFSWRSKLKQQIGRYEELENLGKLKSYKTTPWEFFVSPLFKGSKTISERDIKLQKLAILNRWIYLSWSHVASAYIFGIFPASILSCAICIELMIKGIALRDDDNLFQELRKKTGFCVNLLKKMYKKEFSPIEKQLKEIQENRGNIIAHGINIIEQKAKREELWEILTREIKWHEQVLSPNEGHYIIHEFKNLAERTIELTIDVLDYLQNLRLDRSRARLTFA